MTGRVNAMDIAPCGKVGPMTNKIGWIVGSVVAVLLLAAGATTVVLASGGDPTTVEEVADAAVEAAEDLDIDAGVDLLCDTPSKSDREELEELIETARDETGTDDPDVDYDVSNFKGEEEGSFEVRITSSEPDFEDEEIALQVNVEKDGDRSCITGVDDLD